MVWVLFDYALVISEPQPVDAIDAMAAHLGAEPAAFEAAYWLHRDAYDRGDLDRDGYWQAVGAAVGAAPGPAVVAAASDVDVAGWLHASPATVAVLHELQAGGVKLALLSNAPAPIAEAAADQEWAQLFGPHLYFSSQLGETKPSAAAWLAVLERIGAEPAEVVFVDDRLDNTATANALGLRTIHFRDADQLRADLRLAGVL